MKTGTVHVYSADNGLGVIKCSKKERYIFERKDWLSDIRPTPGLFVKFEAQRLMAKNIIVIRMGDDLETHP
jgi:hypothetical protein